mgnify:CR=1 FL=1
MNLLRKISFQNKLFLFYSLFMVIVLSSTAIIFYLYISHTLQTSEENGIKQQLVRTNSAINTHVNTMDTLTTEILFSKSIQEIMYDANEAEATANYFDIRHDDLKKAVEVMVSINSPKISAKRIGIFNMKGTSLSVGTVSEQRHAFNDNIKTNLWIAELIQSSETEILSSPQRDDWFNHANSETVISFYRKLIDSLGSNTIVGYIEVQQPYSDFQAIIEAEPISHVQTIILDKNGDVVYPYAQLNKAEIVYFQKFMDKEAINTSTDRVQTWEIDNRLTLSQKSSLTGWTTIVTIPNSDFMKPVYFIQRILLISGSIFLLLTIIVIYYISSSLTSPIREMRKLIRNLSFKNFSINLSNQTGNNEVALLGEVLTKSFIRLKDAMDQTIEARTSEAHAHVLALQAQMNPHFLFNTLMAINGAAWEAGNHKIIKMCEQLSEMLRYTASFADENVTLQDEVKHTLIFLELTRWRLEDHLEYSHDIDPDLLQVKVPKLILQPIVENCFSHSFKNSSPPFIIKIRGYKTETHWVLSITDNGAGLDDASISEIMSKLVKYKMNLQTMKNSNTLEIGGMALANIYLRLYLLNGDDCIFQIDSNQELDTGVTVTISGKLGL